MVAPLNFRKISYLCVLLAACAGFYFKKNLIIESHIWLYYAALILIFTSLFIRYKLKVFVYAYYSLIIFFFWAGLYFLVDWIFVDYCILYIKTLINLFFLEFFN